MPLAFASFNPPLGGMDAISSLLRWVSLLLPPPLLGGLSFVEDICAYEMDWKENLCLVQNPRHFGGTVEGYGLMNSSSTSTY